MISREQAIDIMSNLNERAHAAAWSEWVEAEKLEDEGDEDAAEHQRDCASEIQMDFFADSYTDLDVETRRAIAVLALADPDFYEDYWEPWCPLDPELEAEQ
jgi:hypothetical protein